MLSNCSHTLYDSFNVTILPQWSECHQLQTAAIRGDVVTVERLINTRYIDVNTTDVVSTLYGVVLVCE